MIAPRQLAHAGWVLLAALWGCGRFGFAPGGGSGDDGGIDDGGIDDPDATACPPGELRAPSGTCVPALALDGSVVGYWPLDEAAGERVFRDLSPNGHDGTCVDPCPVAGVPGVRGRAVDFIATVAGIEVGVLPELTAATPGITVAAWVRVRAYDTYSYILSNDRDCCGAYTGFSLWASHYGLGPALLLWDGTDGPSVQPAQRLALDAWHHVVGTYAGGTARVFVDGTQVASATRALALPPSFATRIGAMGYDNIDYSLQNGAIDEVLLLARAIDADEIATLHATYVANGSAATATPLTTSD